MSAGTGSPEQGGEGSVAGHAGNDDAALRREHDALAERLAARRSIDEIRKAAYASFFGFITAGLSVKLAWDRWVSERATRFRGPPVFFFVAVAVTVVILAFAIRAFVRARRHMQAEDVAFTRLRQLRDRLGLEP